LSDVGLSFHEEGAAHIAIRDIFWDDVANVSSTSPPPISSFTFWRRRSSSDADSFSHQVQLELCQAPFSFRLQFGVSQPVEALKKLWGEATDSFSSVVEAPGESGEDAGGDPSDPASFNGCPVLADARKRGGLPAVLQQTLKTGDRLPGDGVMTLASVRAQMLREDESWPFLRVWKEDMNIEVLHLSSWMPLANGDGFIRRLHMRLPLKPLPMAPKSTRVSIIYHLKGGENGEPLVVTDRTYTIDVPYGTCFMVQGDWSFTEAEPGEGVGLERSIGIDWSSRVVLKGIIERTTRSEALLFIPKLMQRMVENLAVQTS